MSSVTNGKFGCHQPLHIQQLLLQKHLREDGQVASLVHTSESTRPGRGVALSAGPGEKPSSQLVCRPGRFASGFPALHNFSIRAYYIRQFSLSGDRETSRSLQNTGEKRCYETPKRRPGMVQT